MVRRTGADTRQEILEAATRLFIAYGYRGTSLSDIANAIDYSKASVLYHFASKEALLSELVSPAARDLESLLGRLTGLPPESARRVFVEGFVDLAVKYRESVAILETEAPFLLQDPRFRTIGVLYERMLHVLEGEHPDAQSRVAALVVLAGSAAACVERADLPPDELRQALVTVALHALGLPEQSP